MSYQDLIRQTLQSQNTLSKPPSYYYTNKKNKLEQPFYMDVLDFFARPQRAITGGLANITDRDRNTTLLGGVWDNLSGRKKVDFDQVMNNFGWKQNEANQRYDFFKGKKGAFDLFDIVNFAGNVGLDPLTYVTFGAGSIAKSGARAMAEEAAKQASKYGVSSAGDALTKAGAKRAANLTSSLIEDAIKKHLSKGRELTEDKLAQIERIARKKAERADAAIVNAGNAARLRDQNALINFDIPFTNISKSFGKKPKFLQIKDKTIDPIQVEGTLKMFSEIAGQGATDSEIKDIIKYRYKKENISDLTQQELEDLQQLKFLEYSKKPVKADLEGAKDKFDFADELERLIKIEQPDAKITSAQLAEKLDKEELLKQINEAVDNINAKRASETSLRREALDFLGNSRFQQDAGGQSKLGDLLRPFNPFNKRTVVGNSRFVLNKAAEEKTEIDNFMLSQVRQAEKDEETLQKILKTIPKEQRGVVGYIIENKFPKDISDLNTYLKATFGDDRYAENLQTAADFIKTSLRRYGKLEENAGLRARSVENYFPHIQDFDAQQMAGVRESFEENLKDPVIGKFLAQSSKNPYAKRRKAFKTLSEVDDAISTLSKERESLAPDSVEFEKINKKITLLENLFKRDPQVVFSERVKTAIRSAAMKALQNQYELDGLIIRKAKLEIDDVTGETSIGKEMSEKGFRKLTNKEAEAIGLTNVLGREQDETILIDSELYDFLTESIKYTEIEPVNKAVESLNAATNVFKSLYTSLVPKHYFYNLVGSVFNNTMAGVTIDSYYKAGNLLNKFKNGTLTPKELKIVETAFNEGILNQTSFADLVRPEILAKGREGSIKEKDKKFYEGIDNFNRFWIDNPLAKGLRKYAGDPIDNISRLAHYVHVLETTRSTKKASESVRKHLFNYNEVSKTDRWVKTALPFWNWMKNNIPLQINKLITEPRIAATYSKIREESFGEKEASDFPKYIQEGFIKTPWGENSFYNPRLPLQDLQQVTDPISSLLNALTPVGKIPLETQTNYQIFSERPVSYRALYDPEVGYFTNEDSAAEFLKYANANLGILGDAIDVGQWFTKPEEERKHWFDMLTDNLFGSTSTLK